ncbi:MAG: type II secretion system secretin GspD [Deltaproteobacteria bacterium]|nr:type II secretion system secretin GspD [Deltaproteobacteria bacterium]
MKQVIAIVLCALLFTVSFSTGCAGPTTQIKDKGVKAEAEGGAQAAGPAEKELSAPVPGQQEPAVPLTPASPAAAAAPAPKIEPASPPLAVPPTPKAEPASPAPGTSAGTTEKPAEKTYVDKKGQFEITSTPFGYVKREIKRAEKELSAPVPGQRESVIPLTPVVKAPAAPPAPKAAPAGPSPSAPASPASPAPATPPAQSTETRAPEKTGQVSLDFDDADLYAVIRTMADILKINYLMDTGVSGKVTIHTAGVLRAEDVFPIFFQMLEVNGLTAVKEGNVYRILRLKDALRMPIAARLVREAKDIPPEERIIIQIIPLKFISVSEITKVITPFISADGTIISEAGSNTLLVVDKGVNILKVLRLIEVFDVSVFEKVNYRFYTFENINTEDAVKLLKEVLSLYPGSDNVKFIPITRLNTLIVVSPSPDIFGRMDAFIRQVDVPSEAAKPQIYIYSVKNGMATELGDILNSIFGRGGEIKKSAGKESVPTNPFAKGSTETKTTAAPSTAAARAATETGPSLTLRGDIRITADPIRNALIIEAIPGDYQIVEKILGRLDVLPRQVLIEVVIAEIALGKGTELGIEWTFKKDNWTDTGLLSASVGASGLQYAIGLSQKWQVALHALARDSKVNILSSPSVLASDNKQAKIDVTTEVPIPSTSYVIQTTGPNVLETKVEYRNTGVILDVTPHISEQGLVTMDISQEVSNVGELLKVADKDYYSFNKRKITTSLTVKHNQTIVIGGLISSTKSDAATGVPWLVNIPLIRWLFGTETTNASKAELIVMITPRVITSLDDVDAVSEEFKKKIGNAITTLR